MSRCPRCGSYAAPPQSTDPATEAREIALQARDQMLRDPGGEPVTVITAAVEAGMAAQRRRDVEACKGEAQSHRNLQKRHKEAEDHAGAACHGVAAAAMESCIAFIDPNAV